MNANSYQRFVVGLLSPESRRDQMVNAALGLAGEVGEYVDMVKKHKHHGHDLDRDKIKLELGDIAFYLASAADEQGLTFEEILQCNVDKLTKRYPKGVFDAEDSKIKRDQEKLTPDLGGTTGTTGDGGTLPL